MNSASNPELPRNAGATRRLAARLSESVAPTPWWVAFSGGPDSLALLAATRSLTGDVGALHIDHGLHPDSGQWVERCRRMAAALGVALHVERVNVAVSGEGVEAAAREARYAVFERVLSDGGTLLTAHHAEDQAETQLLQLLRGSGLAGLAGMPAERGLGRGKLIRPWLAETKDSVHRVAEATGLAWIQDPDNDDLRRDRNFLRHRIIPALAEQWSNPAARLARSAGDARSNLALLTSLADEVLDGTLHGSLPLALLRRADAGASEWLLRYWLSRQGVAPPGRHRLAQGLTDLIHAGEDAHPVLAWSGAQIRRQGDRLVLLPPRLPGPIDTERGVGAQTLALSDGSRLGFQRRRDGIAAQTLADGWHVAARAGGERLAWRGHSQQVKKLLQATDMPAWQRAHYPLLWSGEQVIAVPGVAVADGCRARVGYWPIWTSSRDDSPTVDERSHDVGRRDH